MKENLIQKTLNKKNSDLIKPYSVTFISTDEGNGPTINFNKG